MDNDKSGLRESRMRAGYKTAAIYSRIHRIRSVLTRYGWIIFAGATVGIAIKAYMLFSKPAIFTSSAQMIVAGQFLTPDRVGYRDELQNYFGTQVALLNSSEVRLRAIARVHTMFPEIPPDAGVDMRAVQQLRTSIFDLRAFSSNPRFAQAFLNAVMAEYLLVKSEQRSQSTDSTLTAITLELARLDQELQKYDQELIEFQKTNNMVFVEEQNTNTANYLIQLNNDLAHLKTDYELMKLATTSSGKDGGAKSVSAQLEISLQTAGVQGPQEYISKAKREIELLVKQRDELARYLRPAHPKLILLEQTIAQQNETLKIFERGTLDQLEKQRVSLELKMQNLKSQISDLEGKSFDLSRRLGEYQKIKSKRARAQAFYDNLSASVQRIDVNKTIGQENVSVLQPASSSVVVQKNYPREIAMGLFLGFVGGCAVVYLISRLADRIDTVLDLEDNINLAIRGIIPSGKSRNGERPGVLGESPERHVQSEAYRNIRSSLLFMGGKNPLPKKLLITSAIPAEGKSTVSSNLAITFASMGTRTLLVDADLRRGVGHRIFGLKDAPGLSEFLQQQLPWTQTVQSTRFPNLDFISRGKTSSHPGDLFLGNLVDLFFAEISAQYDLIVIDSAPMMAADDTSNLSPRVDGVLFVVRMGYSSFRNTQGALDLLRQRNVKLTGLICNDVKVSQSGNYYAQYRYSKYYVSSDN